MTRLVLQAIESGENPQVLKDLHRICGEEEGSIWVPKSPQEITNRIFCVRAPGLISSASLKMPEANVPLCQQTAYMGMEKNSSPETRKRAADLAEVIGANHLDFKCVFVSSPTCPRFWFNYHFMKSFCAPFVFQAC